MKKNKIKRGMTLIELIISLALLGIIIVPISSMALSSLKNSLQAEQKQRARYRGKVFLEQMKYYDEIILKKDDEKTYFNLLDNEVMVKDSTLNKYTSKVEKDNFKIEMEVNEDTTFEYNDINNLENISEKSLKLDLNERKLELKLKDGGIETLLEGKDYLNGNLSNDLIISFEKESEIEIKEKNSSLSLKREETNIVNKPLIIYVDKDFELEKRIEIENKTSQLIKVYVIRHNESKGKVNVVGIEGNIIINDDINLYENNIEGKRYNFSVKVTDKNNKLLFEGSSSRNLIIKDKRGEEVE